MTASARLTRAFEVLDRRSAQASNGLFALGVYGALPALLGLVTLDVGLRYFFNAPLQWSRDANGLLLLVALFSALPAAWDQGHHIRMEIIYLRLSARWRAAADVCSALAGIVFFGLLAVQAVLFTRYMAATGETGEDLAAPLWPFMAFIAVCGFIFVARLIANPLGAQPDSTADRKRWI
jgi:TRAP-type C4-dicarboxylate transport system permease small subunit